jgi:serine/threonine-protein kinase
MNPPEPSPPGSAAPTGVWTSDPAFHSPRDLTGTTLGDFRVERLLGRGGMGEVYLATQVSLNRPVALKVLRPDLLANPTYRSRFEVEAWAAAKLNHANIVHIYTLGCIDGLRFIAMEYVQGTNLREYLERKGPPELPLALQIMRQAGQAVGAAGEVGLVHRDIKPENLLLTRKGQVKIADFGLCRDKEGEHINLTQTGVTMGTPMYMSPEQVQGHALDHRSDLYSLGVTFYHMLAGVPPFRAETSFALALKHVRDEPPSLSVHRPDLPKDLVALVMKLMEKRPADRYQSAGEMLKDLSKIRESMTAISAPISVSMPEALVQTLAEPARTKAKAVEKAPRAGASARPKLAKLKIGAGTFAATLALAAVAGGVGGWLARADDLLGENAPAPKALPGLWMAPWDRVPVQRTALEQYRYAQVQAAPSEVEAAFLAVPGRFPGDVRYRAEAYTQLVRYLFRHNDVDRLNELADEFEHHPQRQHEEKGLAAIARAAAAALEDDVKTVLDLLDGDKAGGNALSEGGAELCLEIVLHAAATPTGRAHPTLPSLARGYLKTLRVEFLEPSDLYNP